MTKDLYCTAIPKTLHDGDRRDRRDRFRAFMKEHWDAPEFEGKTRAEKKQLIRHACNNLRIFDT